MFMSAVTLKNRSRSRSPNQGFSMSKFYIYANFGRDQVIGSGNIKHISLLGLNLARFVCSDLENKVKVTTS